MTSAQPDKFSQKRKTTHKEEQESAAIRKVFAKEKDHPQKEEQKAIDINKKIKGTPLKTLKTRKRKKRTTNKHIKQ